MDERGEVEIRINTRMVERAVFAIIIIVLAVLYFTKGAADTSSLKASVATLTQQLAEKTSQTEQLQTQLSNLQNATNNTKPQIIVTATPPPAPIQNTTNTTPVAPTCSGKVEFNWTSQGEFLTVLQYNADQIASLQGNLTDLQIQYNATNNTNIQSNLQTEISDLTNQLRTAKIGDPKYNVDNVTLTASNGEDSPATFSYIMCWLSLDCGVVHTQGNINLQACSSKTFNVDFTNLPHKISVPMGNQQTLRLTVSDANDNVIFKDDKSFSSSLN